MVSATNLMVKLSERLLRWRWLVVVVVSLLTIGFEVLEHLPDQPGGVYELDAQFLREVLFFGLVGPLIGGVVLSLLAHTRYHLDRHHALSEQLSSIQSWDELTAALVQFPRSILPLAGASLFVYDPVQRGFQLANEWWHPDWRVGPPARRLLDPDFCSTCRLAQAPVLWSLSPGQCFQDPRIPDDCKRYGLALMQASVPIALLFLYVPRRVSLAREQVEVLNGVAPAMALAIDNTRPQRSAIIRAKATEAERRRIARDLHDSLGQSLGYLHLKLDQLTGDDAVQEIEAVRTEVERMRDIANQAYEQVRGTLNDLRAEPAGDLATALLAQARKIGRRAAFGVQLTTAGQTRPLAPHVQRQLCQLFQEALINVEKHSDARQVSLELVWEEHALTVVLSDDGRGFDANAQRREGHHGLDIMQERAQELGGTLVLNAGPGGGTQITVRLPLGSAVRQSALR